MLLLSMARLKLDMKMRAKVKLRMRMVKIHLQGGKLPLVIKKLSILKQVIWQILCKLNPVPWKFPKQSTKLFRLIWAISRKDPNLTSLDKMGPIKLELSIRRNLLIKVILSNKFLIKKITLLKKPRVRKVK